MKRTFTQDQLDAVGFPWSGERTITGQGRWDTYYDVVFEYDGKFWKAEWSEGSTEYQENDFWDIHNTVEAVQVEKRPVTVEQWVEVD